MKLPRLMFSYEKYDNGIIAITAPMGERIYLVMGNKMTAVIDTGMGIGSLREVINSLTTLPLMVINTHGHPDHAGGNVEFDDCRMHKADQPLFTSMCSKAFRINDIHRIYGNQKPDFVKATLSDGVMPSPIADGEQIDLGGRTITVFHVPGHTPGCICLLDSLSGAVLAGDSLSGHSAWVYDTYSTSLAVFAQSLHQLAEIPATAYLVGHAPGKIPADTLMKMLNCVDGVLQGKLVGKPVRTFAGEGLEIVEDGIGFIYNPHHIND